MLDNKLTLPQEIYFRYLETVGGVKFTPREMEVISCVCETRLRTKEIAAFLSIAPKTVGSYITAIMGKMDCSSRETIIEFIKKSGQSSFIKRHYLALRIRNYFEQQLKKIRLSPERLHCEIIFWINQTDLLTSKLQKSLQNQLNEHLERVSITINQTTKNSEGFARYKKEAKHPVFHMAFKNLVEQLQTSEDRGKIGVYQLTQTDPENAIFLAMNREAPIDPEACKNNQNYYFSVFEILKSLFSDISFDKFIIEFKEQCELIHNGAEETNYPLILKLKELSQTKNPFRDLRREVFNKKGNLLVVGCLLCFSILSVLFLGKASQNKNTQEIQSVCADLLIPTQTAFLQRPTLMAQLEEKLKGKEDIQTVALVGIGGAGKTTLARHFGRSQYSSIIWEINAETNDSLVNSFKDLAYALARTKEQKEEIDFIQKIQNPEEKEKQILCFVRHGLKENNGWVLMYDNVETFFDIKNYFPQDSKVWGIGKVIITTRDGNIKNTSYIKPENIIHIEELNQLDALTLFSKILYERIPGKLALDQKEKAVKFLQNIPPFPLDVSVAAYYIKNSQITFEQYLARINQHSQHFERAQEALLKEICVYTKTRYGIITSSLEKLININPDFKELLLFICLLDSQNIPKELLELYKDNSIIDSFIFDLKKYSLITNETSTTFFLHRSTQIIGQVFLLSLFSEADKTTTMDKIIATMKSFYELHSKEKYIKIISFIPHLENLIKNLRLINVTTDLIEKYERDLLLVLGYTHKKYSNNLILAKNYLTRVYALQSITTPLPISMFAELLKDLGYIHMYLSNNSESLFYSQESINLCKKISHSEIIIAENLKIMGDVYQDENDFKKAKGCLEAALKKISTIGSELKREIESEIYRSLALIHITQHFNKKEIYEAEKYVLKSLEILNASELFLKNQTARPGKISCYVAWDRTMLGRVYNCMGEYDKAMSEGFREAEYIREHSLDNCSHSLLNTQISHGIGEIFLRRGQLDAAEKQLTKSICARSNLIGVDDTWRVKVFRAEANIRRGKLAEAYEDCSFVFKIEKKMRNHYYDLLYFTCFYHAAIIKYKQADLLKSLEHFADFFKEMKPFCQSFLEEKEYKELEGKGVFVENTYNKDQIKTHVTQCLYHSATIFSVIYGSSHPFVQDYVLQNCSN